jgi:hypothetical protein
MIKLNLDKHMSEILCGKVLIFSMRSFFEIKQRISLFRFLFRSVSISNSCFILKYILFLWSVMNLWIIVLYEIS